MNDILLYGTISQYSAMYFFEQIKEVLELQSDAQLALRVNVDGGAPDFGMCIIEKVQELASQMIFKGGASLHSMGLFLMVYLPKESVECLDTTMAVLHRAAWPSWLESMDGFAGSIHEDILIKANKDLEKATRNRIDVEALEALPAMKDKNITLKDIFSLESRLEVLLTANDLKKIGLVGKINKITPTKSAEIIKQSARFTECRSLDDFKLAAKAIVPPQKTEETLNTMTTIKELTAAYPALVAEIIKAAKAEGHLDGIAAEKDRVESIMVYAEIDPAGCKAAIESGKTLTGKQMAEFSLKAVQNGVLAKVKKDSEGKIITEEPAEVTEKEKQSTDFMAKVDAQLHPEKAAKK